MTALAYRAVTRELLVRYLDACAPRLLHGHRRFSYVQGYPDLSDEPAALDALRVFGEFADLPGARTLGVVLVDPDPDRLAAARAGLVAAAGSLGLAVRLHTGPGPLTAELAGAGALGAPILAYLDATGQTPPEPATLRALGANPATDVLLLLDAGQPVGDLRDTLHGAGFPLVTQVELVGAGQPVVPLFFATGAERHLDAVKDALWAVDEYAGVRYRDPGDPEHALLDISLRPNLGPLRRRLLAHLTQAGPRTVAQLRHLTRTETVYRPADAARAITALLSAGAVNRSPVNGRLGADTLISMPTT